MQYPKFKIFFLVFLSLIFFGGISVFAQTASSTISDLQSKIDQRNGQIKQLEAEISQYNLEVTNASKQSQTLQSTLKTLDLTKKKLTTDLSLTEVKINKTQLTIQQLNDEISSTISQIDKNKNALGQIIQNMQISDDFDLFQTILSRKRISDIWDDIENVKNVQNQIFSVTAELKQLSADMITKQNQAKSQKNQLLALQTDLSGKKQVVENTTQEKATLLALTQNKESAFKALVQTKEQQKNQFEKELYDFESQLNLSIDKNSYPKPMNSILSWPLDEVFVTQKFGKTVGADRLYASGSHNGVDFRASIGTRVKSVLGGVVVGTGNTDIYPGCYSFGKWVMIKHDNGLSTVYGHLSVISVSTGQSVTTGDILGYSGNTGYTTGPHLHLGLYATQGVRIEKYVNSIGCKQATIPIADIKAYLDPLAYLPNL